MIMILLIMTIMIIRILSMMAFIRVNYYQIVTNQLHLDNSGFSVIYLNTVSKGQYEDSRDGRGNPKREPGRGRPV